MAKYFLIFLVGFLCEIFLFEPSTVSANAFKLTSVSVEGNNRISRDAIFNYSELKLASIVSNEDLSRAYKNIISSELFKSVEFSQSGGNLKIFVQEYPTVNSVSFEGNKRFTDEKLEPLITIKPRFVFTPFALESDLTSLKSFYKNAGRLGARIEPKIIKLSDNRVNVVFEIYDGPLVEIEKISFVGNRDFTDRRLRRVLQSKQAGPLRKVILRDVLIEERIAVDRRLLTEFYRSRGYIDFKINDINAELSEEKDGFFIVYNIKEGPQFKVGQVSISSQLNEIDTDEFYPLIKLKSGEIYSPSLIELASENIEENLELKGYNFIRAEPQISKNLNELVLNINFKLVKGERLFIERIDINGNTSTLDRVIRRQFFLAEGDPFSRNKIRAARERIKSLGLFSKVEVNILRGQTNSNVIVDVNVREKPTGSLSFGAGYSSASGLGGIIEYGEKNFLGRGQSLSFAIKTGKDDQLYEFLFFEPMFLRNDLGFGFNVSWKDTNKQNADYDTSAILLQPYLIFPIGDKSTLKVDYSYSENDLSNAGSVGGLIADEVSEGNKSSSGLGYMFTHDSRLYKTGPKNGFLFQLGQKFIGLGGDQEGVKSTVKAAAYREAFKEELKMKAVFEGGNLSLNKGSSSVNDRFFLSSSKMRGFKPGGLGPRECPNRQCTNSINDALGGENFAVARFEAEFPLGLPEEYGISGGLFYDIGNLWSLSQTNSNVLYEEGSWRQSIGASIFWKTPIGPLRFNFSDVLSKDLYDLEESFDLTISTRF